jgi:hypothetical protein
MEQRITVERLQELTEEQKQRLRGWWKPKCYDVYINHYDTYMIAINDHEGNMSQYVTENKHKLLPLLSIGQIIELLMSFDLNGETEQNINDGIMWMNEGLCDALWKEVLRVL